MVQTKFKINYIEDIYVDSILDQKIRTILSKCFSYEPRFATQRYANDLPKHRWYIEDGPEIVAHLAAHEKEFIINQQRVGFIGIAEVCVIPEYRGKKLVQCLLEKAESICPEYEYSILLGEPQYYSSSGYFQVGNISLTRDIHNAASHAMVKCLHGSAWPAEAVVIEGLPF
jgi:Predicted acetyltransferase